MKSLKFKSSVLPLLAVCFASCISTQYMGEHMEPTTNVDVFYAVKDVKNDYKVIGHITAATTMNSNATDIKLKLVEKAKAVGADGVIIGGVDYTGGKDSAPFYKADAIKYKQ